MFPREGEARKPAFVHGRMRPALPAGKITRRAECCFACSIRPKGTCSALYRCRIHFLAFALLLLTLLASPGRAQKHPLLSSGPMPGYAEMTETVIWVQTTRGADAKLRYWPQGKPGEARESETVRTRADGDHIARFTLTGLAMGQQYEYELYLDNRKVARDYPLAFRTQPLWRHRGDPPTFTFAVGSCAYINDPPFDRPGTPYGGDYEIFTALAGKRPDFMVWLGDNIYYREPDWLTESAMRYRWRHNRALDVLQPLLAATHHYAIWDDHDYGPNDSDGSFRLKEAALRVFTDYFPGVVYGADGVPGCFYRFEWGDVEFFMLDDRYHRDPNALTTDPAKRMLGEAQMAWLKRSLASSRAPFKIIANGGQMINPIALFEGFAQFPAEQKELLDFIAAQKVEGVVFLSGDRHSSELLKITPAGGYPLYEFTCSPLTAGATASLRPEERDNPARVPGTLVTGKRNFGVITVSGRQNERRLTMVTQDKDGKELWRHELRAQELRFPAAPPSPAP